MLQTFPGNTPSVLTYYARKILSLYAMAANDIILEVSTPSLCREFCVL